MTKLPFVAWAFSLALTVGSVFAADSPRQTTRIDDGWHFALGHANDPAQDFDHGMRPFFFAKAGYGDGPAAADFEDRPWRRVDLPHDWAVELPFSERGSSQHGMKAIGRAFPENSVGWYRRELSIPKSARGQRIALEFDGVFRDSVVWVNGHYLHREASGYSSFQVEIANYLNFGGRNVVAVRVDATTQEGWWYEGAGIYRHVWLMQTAPLHVAPSGTFVRTTVNGESADVAVDTTVRNAGSSDESFALEHELRDPVGRIVARARVPARRVAGDAMGVLVVDEHRMMSTAPQIRDELERMVRRDRNHPSVILWSVGNEEWAIENNEIGTHLAREMQAIVRRLDPTRPSTLAASSSGQPEGTSVGSQVIGFNYKGQHDIEAMHRRFPERPMVVTEEGLTFATRGIYADDPARVHIAAYDKRSGGDSTSSIEEAWAFNAERPFLAGMFVWTGFDYRGETTPFGWPAISSQFGMMDTTGAMKDSGQYLKAAWTTAPMAHVLPHWNWPGREGQPINRITFETTGPVRLTGMGNGDPGSHEADKPAELHRYAAATQWRYRGLARAEDATTLMNDAGAVWRDPFAWIPPEQQPADPAWNMVQATVTRMAPAGQPQVLFLGDVAPGVRFFLDGRALTPRREAGTNAIDFDSTTGAGAVLTAVFPTPAGGTRALFDSAQSGRRWATLRSTTPAAAWQRSVFNGHAQVTLQSAGDAGRATLRATGVGLASGEVVIEIAPN